MHEWSSGHSLLHIASDWYVLTGPEDEGFDLGRVWDEWKPGGSRSSWETITETADCGCLIVHLHER